MRSLEGAFPLLQTLLWYGMASLGVLAAASDIGMDRLLRAQLHVLRLQVRAERYSGSSDQVDRMVGYYTSRGMPADAFSKSALRAAARRYLADVVQRQPAIAVPQTLRKGECWYGISPETVFELVRPSQSDPKGLFQRYLSARNPSEKARLRREMSEVKPTPAVTRALIRLAQEAGTQEASNALLLILKADWSREGLDYLYDRLATSSEKQEKLDILEVLENRREMKAGPHIRLAEQTDDRDIREAIFKVATSALLYRSQEARQFFLHEIGSDRVENRAIAVRMVVARRHEIGDDALRRAIDAIFAEKDPKVRAKMIPALRPISGYSHIRKRLVSILKDDPSIEVRLAALEALPLYPEGGAQVRPRQAKFIEQLKKAVGPNAPTALREALERKLAAHDRKSEELRQRRLRHMQRREQIRQRLIQQNQKQQTPAGGAQQ